MTYFGHQVPIFSLKGLTLRKIPSFLSLNQPRISHEYNVRVYSGDVPQRCKICQLAEFRCLNLCVPKSETRWEIADRQCFPNDFVVKLETSLTM